MGAALDFLRRRAVGLSAIVGILIIWQGLALSGLYPTYLFPPPTKVAHTFVDITADNTLLINTKDSLIRQWVGFLLAVVSGLPFGILLGSSDLVRKLFLPLSRFIYPIPGIAWVPLSILWFGLGFGSTVFAVI